jgi:hypothetical protein
MAVVKVTPKVDLWELLKDLRKVASLDNATAVKTAAVRVTN